MKRRLVLPCDTMGGCVFCGRIATGRQSRIITVCTASMDKFPEKPPCPTWSDDKSWDENIMVPITGKKELMTRGTRHQF